MTYLRSLFINFLIVFFVDRVIPGIEVSFFEHVPNIGADLVFSAIVGFLNSMIFPTLVFMNVQVSTLKIAIISFVISYAAFISIAFINFGVVATNGWGIFFGGLIVWFVAFFTNYLEMKHAHKKE